MASKRLDWTYYRDKAAAEAENNNNPGKLISDYRYKKLFNYPERLNIQLGNTSLLKGDFSKAFRQIRIALAIYPRSDEALDLFGLLLLHFGRYDEAIIKFQRAILRNPFVHLPDSNWSLALYLQGKEDEAERILLCTLQLPLNDIELYLEKYGSLLLVTQNKLLEVLEEAERKPLEALVKGYEWILQRVKEEQVEREQKGAQRGRNRLIKRRVRRFCFLMHDDMMKYHRLDIRRSEIEED